MFCSKGTWKFFAAGHGKGAPDGVGAAVKRLTDTQVHHGKDCKNASDMKMLLQVNESKVKLYLISSEEIDMNQKEYDTLDLQTVKGTTKLHQIRRHTDDLTIVFRDVSCLCNNRFCSCDSPKTHSFPPGKKSVKLRTNRTLRSKSRSKEPPEPICENPAVQSSQNTDLADLPPILQPETLIPPTSDVQCDTSETPPTLEAEFQTEPAAKYISNDSVGKYVAVKCVKKIFPGIVIDIDHDELQVKSMHCIGKNAFFWPRRDDISWYNNDDVMGFISPPEKLSGRHFKVCQNDWDRVF